MSTGRESSGNPIDADGDEIRGGLALRSTERALGWMRLGAFAFGIVQTTIFPWGDMPHHPASAPAMSYALSVVLGVAGIATLAALRRGWELRRVAYVGFAVDATAIIGFSLVYAFEHGGSTHLLMILIPVEAALKFGLAGALTSVVAVAAGEMGRHVLRAAYFDVAPEWNHATFLVGLAALIGGATGLLARSAEQRRSDAEREAERAHQLARLAESSHRELAALQNVVLAGIRARPDEAPMRMAAKVCEQLGCDYVAVVLLDDDGEPYQAVMHGGESHLTATIRPDPGGPVERVLRGGPGEFVTGDELKELSHALSDPAAEAVVPIRVRGQVIGALTAEATEEETLRALDVPLLQQLADQMGLVIESARAYEHEQELAQRYQELDRMKTDFVAITSHELRTPLTAIVGLAETLARDGLVLSPEKRLAMDEAIARQARRLRRLVEDLQTVSRIDAGTLDVHVAPASIAEAVELAIEAAGAGEDAHVVGPDDLRVVADLDRLVQVLTNLIANAGIHGEPPIEIAWEATDGAVMFSVTDQGPGVPESRRHAVFERFVKADDVLSHQRGSGLGLAIARELIVAMDGDLSLDSHYTSGTRFVARMPRAD